LVKQLIAIFKIFLFNYLRCDRPGKNLDSEVYGGAEDLEALR
jgi:hypothetical protein